MLEHAAVFWFQALAPRDIAKQHNPAGFFRTRSMASFYFLMFAGVKVIASFVCFNDAVPEEERQNLTTGADSYPLGIWAPTWASSRLTNAIVNILVTEKMGYNTQVGTGPGTTDQFYAMFGCETPTNLDDRGCGSQETYYHISAEGWTISYHKLWTDLQENYPLTAPENLGSVGYTGVEGEYVQKEILDSAYLKEGLALDYFRGFDARWHNPVEYFHPSLWLFCSITICENIYSPENSYGT